MYIARQSNHIAADIQRNWSSWNFGQDGFEGSLSDLEGAMASAIENEEPFFISGFELYGEQITRADIRELYNGYWVLVDNTNGGGGRGIFGIELNAEDLQSAIQEAELLSYSGEGTRFDAQAAKLVYSNEEIHIFQIH